MWPIRNSVDAHQRIGEQPGSVRRGHDDAELEIFAVVECVIQSGCAVYSTELTSVGVNRDCCFVEHGPEATAFDQDVRQI